MQELAAQFRAGQASEDPAGDVDEEPDEGGIPQDVLDRPEVARLTDEMLGIAEGGDPEASGGDADMASDDELLDPDTKAGDTAIAQAEAAAVKRAVKERHVPSDGALVEAMGEVA
jgi:hypothetical protein